MRFGKLRKHLGLDRIPTDKALKNRKELQYTEDSEELNRLPAQEDDKLKKRLELIKKLRR